MKALWSVFSWQRTLLLKNSYKAYQVTSDWAKLSVLKLSVVKTKDINIIADINQIVMIYLVYMCKHVKELIPQIDCELTEMSERTVFH